MTERVRKIVPEEVWPNLIFDGDEDDDRGSQPGALAGDNPIRKCLTRGLPNQPDLELARIRAYVIPGFSTMPAEEQAKIIAQGYVPENSKSQVGSRKLKAKGGSKTGYRGPGISLSRSKRRL